MVVVIGVVVESIFIQLIAVSLPLQAYTDYLSAESDALKRSQENAIVAWNEGVWNPLYSPQVVSAHLAVVDHIAVAWDATGTGPVVVPLVLIVCGLAAGVGLTAMRRPTHSWRGTAARGILVLAGVAALFYIGLRSYYNDDFYTRNYAPLWKMLDQLNAEARHGDAIILNDSFYRRFFMNYYRGKIRIYTMPDAPGERLGGNPQPAYLTDNPEGQASALSTLILPRLAAQTNRWWFVTEFGPYSEGRLRPTEHFLTRHYFEVNEPLSELDLRLIQFAPINAPPDSVPPWPAIAINADFGAAMLVGCDLPQQVVKAGDVLPLSLLCRDDAPPADVLPFDYSINVSLVDSNGGVEAQRSGPALDGLTASSQRVTRGFTGDSEVVR